MQWQEEVKKFGVTPVVPSLEANTDRALTRLFRGLRGGGTHVAIVTNNLLCTPSFQATVAEKIRARGGPVPTMLIADEAHTLGAESFIRNKPAFFERRLALSATPERQYDPDGTEEIFEFFGPTVYEFGLDRAIGFCLVPYSYYVHACTLNGDELDEFERLSRRIGAAMGAAATEEDTRLQGLLIARRRIIETGQSKIDLLREVLIRRSPRDLEHTLIYASAKNPEQFDEIGKLLTTLKVKWAPVTQDTTRNPKLLGRILDSFAKGANQVLLAKKVLDEGVDIPSIREAFIVASSTVESGVGATPGTRAAPPPRETMGDRARLPRLASGPARARRRHERAEEDHQDRVESHLCIRTVRPERRRRGRRTRESGATHHRLLAGRRHQDGHPEQRKRAHRRRCNTEREAMVSNFERILDEIRKEAHRTARTYGLEPEAVVKLIMSIVDLEDSYRRKAVRGRINQQVKGMIEDAARVGDTREDA